MNPPEKTVVVVISGPSGAGKGTIADGVIRQFAEQPGTLPVRLNRSMTTRARRERESEDAYEFVTRDEFERHIATGGLLEWNEFNGQLYGTPISDLTTPEVVIYEIDINGARQIKRRVPEAYCIFITPPGTSLEARKAELRRRLERDGDRKDIEGRLKIAEEEYASLDETIGDAPLVNCVVENSNIDDSIERATEYIRILMPI